MDGLRVTDIASIALFICACGGGGGESGGPGGNNRSPDNFSENTLVLQLKYFNA